MNHKSGHCLSRSRTTIGFSSICAGDVEDVGEKRRPGSSQTLASLSRRIHCGSVAEALAAALAARRWRRFVVAFAGGVAVAVAQERGAVLGDDVLENADRAQSV